MPVVKTIYWRKDVLERMRLDISREKQHEIYMNCKGLHLDSLWHEAWRLSDESFLRGIGSREIFLFLVQSFLERGWVKFCESDILESRGEAHVCYGESFPNHMDRTLLFRSHWKETKDLSKIMTHLSKYYPVSAAHNYEDDWVFCYLYEVIPNICWWHDGKDSRYPERETPKWWCS